MQAASDVDAVFTEYTERPVTQDLSPEARALGGQSRRSAEMGCALSVPAASPRPELQAVRKPDIVLLQYVLRLLRRAQR